KTTALIGPSGCGKSTLLRLIIRLIEPTTGRVLYDGEPVTAENVLQIRRQTGYVIQDGGLFPHLTAEENVTLVARMELQNVVKADLATARTHVQWDPRIPPPQTNLEVVVQNARELAQVAWRRMAETSLDYFGPIPRRAKIESGNMRARVRELAELVRLPRELLSQFPAELSGGQRQRVSLMRALMLRPKVLLLDEPLAALDPMIRAGLQAELKEIFAELNAAVVFVTHDMAEAAYLGNTIVLLREGRVVQEGTLEDFQQRPKEPFVTEFLNAQRKLVAL
ncbi:MAG: osmoprotectant transport system ATP-binding protein, partial [Fimbriimonadaceae bacterium]|nr:osmoprotectant transport system ATP-binding protein [Fimbriimonadaceae bacterium]